MSHDPGLVMVERVFEILAMPMHNDTQKLLTCTGFLRYAPPEFLADYPRECKAIVGGAFAYGASWKQVADAAGVDITEARSRWADVATPSTR